MRKFLTNQRGVSMVMVVGFLAISVPVVTAALALAGTLSLDSLVKGRLVRSQYSNLGVQQYVEHLADDPADWQDWIDETGCNETVVLNGEEITLSCDPPGGPPGDPPSTSNRQFRSFKEVSPTTAEPNTPTDFTYAVTVYNASGVDQEKRHGHLGHGYWKQPHHFEEWTNYAPTDLYNTVFGLPPGPTTPPNDMTLLDALREGGGHERHFRREAVTALLNAAHPEIDFPMDEIDWGESEIIGYVQEAYLSGNFPLYIKLLHGRNFGASYFTDDDDDGDDSDDEGQEGLTRIYDSLPPGFSYRPGTSYINGALVGDPTIVTKRDKDDGDDDDDDDCGDDDEEECASGNLGPNFWKHADNHAAWTGYTTGQNFATQVFIGVPVNGNTDRTLIQVLSGSSGGDERKMQQEAVAGLLNAAHPNIAYLYTEAEVKTMVLQAYAAGAPDFGDINSLLKAANSDAHFMASGRMLLEWDLEDLGVRLPSGEDLELVFGAAATVPEGNYCNEAWVEPGYKDHDEDDHGDDDDDEHDWGRGTGSDLVVTARVKVGSPADELCPGEAIFVTTRVDAPVILSGTTHRFTYTVELENVGTTTLHVAKINDILPGGFTYVPGSTQGMTSADPTPITNLTDLEGNDHDHLEWSAPFAGTPPAVAPGDTLTLTFQADATVGLNNYPNEVWIYLTEFTGIDDARYSGPTGIVRAMDVLVVTATDSEGNIIGTYEVWQGVDSVIVR
jgi:uncharacterized repeat protein (TIGR01451 family)